MAFKNQKITRNSGFYGVMNATEKQPSCQVIWVAITHLVDLLEQPVRSPEPSADGRIRIEPWKLASFMVERPNA